MCRLLKKYNSIVDNSVNVMKLIRRCDKNGDNILDASEIHELLSVSAKPTSRPRSLL
jgi:hypothetical protein